jgi:hypothetical protein
MPPKSLDRRIGTDDNRADREGRDAQINHAVARLEGQCSERRTGCLMQACRCSVHSRTYTREILSYVAQRI